MSTVRCPETIVSPAPSPGFLRVFPDAKPNQQCGAECKIDDDLPARAPVHCRCPYGHQFLAMVPDDNVGN